MKTARAFLIAAGLLLLGGPALGATSSGNSPTRSVAASGGGGGSSGITALTGPVTASGTGSVASAINLAGGSISGTLPMANVTPGTNGQVMVTNSTPAATWGTVGTTGLAASAVTYAKVQNVAATSLLGNPTGSPAAPSEITLGANLSFSGTTLVASGSGFSVPAYTSANGTALGDSSATVQPGTDAVSQYEENTTLTANRSTTIGVAGPPPTNLLVTFPRKSGGAFTMSFINAGPAGGTLPCTTSAASGSKYGSCSFLFNGADWTVAGFRYVTQ